jgi:hypothetical protein
MLRHMAFVRTDVSEERFASIIRMTRIDEIGTRLSVTGNRSFILSNVLWLLVIANIIPRSPILVTLMMDAKRSSEMLVLTEAARRNISEEGTLHSRRRRRENLKSYTALTGWAL